jgi:hypothetical protein
VKTVNSAKKGCDTKAVLCGLMAESALLARGFINVGISIGISM